VTFQSSDSNILTISQSTATILRSGTVTIAASYPGDLKYQPVYASVTITIKPARLVVIADDKTVVRGTSIPTLTCYTDGLKNDDVFSNPIITTMVKDSSTTGTYAITVDGGTVSNPSYLITYQSGTLRIVDGKETGNTNQDDEKTGVGGTPGTESDTSRGHTGKHSQKRAGSSAKPQSRIAPKTGEEESPLGGMDLLLAAFLAILQVKRKWLQNR
jgi:hypothetical protein